MSVYRCPFSVFRWPPDESPILSAGFGIAFANKSRSPVYNGER